jgi:hypothetical protein
MEVLRCLILKLSNAERFGGRVEILDTNTLVLYDCLYWGSLNTDVVLSHHPEAQISIKACRQSLSGFTVQFFLPQSTHREVFWYFVIGVVLACCAYALLRPPWAAEKLVQYI